MPHHERERRAIAWQSAAERIGVVSDPEAERMTRESGGVTIAITTRESDGDFWLVATLGYASLGLDLDLTRRKWTDRIAPSVVKIGVPELDEHLAALTAFMHDTVDVAKELEAAAALVPAPPRSPPTCPRGARSRSGSGVASSAVGRTCTTP